MGKDIHSITGCSAVIYPSLYSEVFFLLSGMKASIFSLLNERLFLVPLARATLTHLQAIQSGSKASSSEACLLNCSEVESAVRLCFSRNCSKTNTKLLALGFWVFGVVILV